jgi:hypothetical protein
MPQLENVILPIGKNKRFNLKVASMDTKCLCPTMETQLTAWIHDLRGKNTCISGSMIQDEACGYKMKPCQLLKLQDKKLMLNLALLLQQLRLLPRRMSKLS